VIDAVGNPQTLLLLGGSSDIAVATAVAYARIRPLRVVLAARDSPRRGAVVVQLGELGCAVDVVDFDAADTARHDAAIGACFAGGDVDVCVVAFGVLGDQERAWREVEAAVAMAQTNYVGAVSVGVLVGQRMQAQGHGSIVALSTVAAERPAARTSCTAPRRPVWTPSTPGSPRRCVPLGCTCRWCAPGSCTVG